jgi:putative ABC transport system substrate-binding protein
MARPCRRRFLQGSAALSGLALLSGCGLGPPPAPPVRVRRILYLGNSSDEQADAFRDGLRQRGYIESETISIEYRSAQGENDRLAALTAELVGLNVECIVASGITESSLAKQASTTIPIVVVLHNFDVVETGLVANIARPEGNITGTAGVSGLRLQTKLLEIIKDAVPDAGRVAILAYARQPSVEEVLEGLKEAAGRLGMDLEIAMVQEPGDIEPAFPAIIAAGARALVILNQTIFSGVRAQIVALALSHRLPAISTTAEFPRAGGLLAYGVNRLDNLYLAATYVDKILKGARPADLPMERPRKYDLVLNLKTAQTLGLAVPKSILEQATEIIQ